MTLTRRKIFSLLGIFILGAIIGGAIGESIGEYRASRFLGSFFSDGSNLSTIVAIKEKVFILSKLRDGKMEGAIETLEAWRVTSSDDMNFPTVFSVRAVFIFSYVPSSCTEYTS